MNSAERRRSSTKTLQNSNRAHGLMVFCGGETIMTWISPSIEVHSNTSCGIRFPRHCRYSIHPDNSGNQIPTIDWLTASPFFQRGSFWAGGVAMAMPYLSELMVVVTRRLDARCVADKPRFRTEAEKTNRITWIVHKIHWLSTLRSHWVKKPHLEFLSQPV